jgi:gluconolactonase
MSRHVRTLAAGVGFTEGPVLTRAGDIVVVAVDRGQLHRIGCDGSVSLLAAVGGGPNGATEGVDGRIYVAQSGGRAFFNPRRVMPGGIQAVRPDGSFGWVTLDPISPNDLCFGPDGLLYLTDPTEQLMDGRLWRVDVEAGEAQLLAAVDGYTNGIGFGPDDDGVYVANSTGRQIVRFPLTGAGLGRPEVAIQMDHGGPDGFAFDVEGNLVIAAPTLDQGGAGGPGPPGRRPRMGIPPSEQGGDIQTWTLEGKLLDVLALGPHSIYTNVALGADRRLVIAASEANEVQVVDDWPCAGLPLHPFRAGREDQ